LIDFELVLCCFKPCDRVSVFVHDVLHTSRSPGSDPISRPFFFVTGSAKSEPGSTSDLALN
jgi:hypothetical protein